MILRDNLLSDYDRLIAMGYKLEAKLYLANKRDLQELYDRIRKGVTNES